MRSTPWNFYPKTLQQIRMYISLEGNLVFPIMVPTPSLLFMLPIMLQQPFEKKLSSKARSSLKVLQNQIRAYLTCKIDTLHFAMSIL